MPSKRDKVATTLIQFYQKPVAKVSLELFLSVGAVIFFALFAIQPTLLTMSDLIKEIEDKEKLSLALTQKIAALNTVQTEFFKLENRLSVLDEAIPTEPQFEEALKIIEKIASDNQLVISSIQVKELPAENDGSETIPFAQKERINLPLTIGLEGDYQSVRSFVEDLRNARRTFVIESIQFTVNENRDIKSLSTRITVGLQYYAPKKVESKKSAPKAPTASEESEE